MVLKWGNGDSGTKTFNFATIVRGPNNSYSSGTATVSILSSENSFSISGYSATGAFSVTVEK